MMKIELLYFEGCPGAEVAERNLREALTAEGLEAEIVPVEVHTDEGARRLRFPGSPTIRIDGEDPFPVPEREQWALSCRTYAIPAGLRGAPTVEMLCSALRQAS